MDPARGPFRVATYNANSIRSRVEIITAWLRAHEPDALCIQETKVTDDQFPAACFSEAGYHSVFIGQKAYNGVAILTRDEPAGVVKGTGHELYDQEARVIRVRLGEIVVVNTYVPQGTSASSPRFQYKLDWIMSLRDYFARSFAPDDLIVWAGDLNVAREPIDVYDPEGLLGDVCYHPDVHKALDYVMEWGFVDVFRKHHPGEPGHYSFWDYRIPNAFKRRLGWRIDHVFATRPLAERSMKCWIDLEPRQADKPSDHTFVVADFDV